MDVVHAGEAGFEGSTSISERENRELDALEKELLEEKKPEEGEAQLAVIEPIKEEKQAEPAEAEPEPEPQPEPEPEVEEEEEEEEPMYE
jgi:hypothetical protein